MFISNPNEDYFVLELPRCPAGFEIPDKPKKVAKKKPNIREKTSFHNKNSPNLFSSILGFFRFATYSTLVFLIGFFALNWQAYSQVVKVWVQGLPQQNFQTDVLNSATQVKEELLPVRKNNSAQKIEIASLSIPISPPDTRIIIPRINKNVPVVPVNPEKLIKRDFNGLEEDIQLALRNGVIHYPGTAWPGEEGNVFITGHSSYYPWDPGRFKDVFALLHEINIGDEITIFHKQKRYVYKIDQIKTVRPQDVDVLSQPKGQKRLTLMTCTPIGTNINRLIVSGGLVNEGS